jgi:hypothetical protein
MRHYTSKEQTAKLIELGFEKPRLLYFGNNTIGHYAYIIGELLSFLPHEIEIEEDDVYASFQITADWELYYTTYSDIFYYVCNKELIDGLFDMCVKLKEKGII